MLTKLLKTFWKQIATVSGILFAIFAIYQKGKSDNKKAIEIKAIKEELTIYEEIKKLDDTLAANDPSGAADRLRDKWSRD